MNRVTWRLFPESEGAAPYILLTNLLIPIYFLLREPTSMQWLGFVLLGLFVILFRQFYYTSKWALHIIIVQVAITLILGAVFHPMYTFVGFLIANSLSKQKLPILISISILFAIGMGAIVVPYVGHAGPELWIGLLPPLFGVSVMPFIIRASMQYKQMAERLEAATVQVERMAQQEERQRIARELHDTLGHTLSLIALKGEVVEKLVKRQPEKAAREASEIRETARAALKQMRELVTEMKVAYFVDESHHAISLCSAAGIPMEFNYRSVSDPSPTAYVERDVIENISLPLTPLQETILAMCFRELITNVVRHSRAESCKVHLDIQEGEVRVSVSDDGIGIDPEQVSTSSNGMAGLRQRLVLVDGRISVSSSSGKGTEITIHIPRTIRDERVGTI
ncbi:sensor histidine kinase [Paenibacillus sp. N3/727]|uniref:sensor histidine kinase n=1 Tax=Paenibacillus sp. N3/727 TaxID=2925845 RepID=UPI001F53AA76|nr:sensor histidine kinase [Paenibacillus sp. N3/727]UNK18790.1 sensor histidine kinase [Paenibacillus sp. N3/727]